MSAFNDLNGIPTSGNSFTLRQILREEWEFNGFVVSDWNSIGELIPHGFAKDLKEASKRAVLAGVDMDMTSGAYQNFLIELIQENKVNEQIVDDSVRRILRIKFQLGLFDSPYTDTDFAASSILKPEYLGKALEVAHKSMVLVKNEDYTLPIKSAMNIALIGPLADDHHEILGTWYRIGEDRDSESVLDGMKTVFHDANITYLKGCDLVGKEEVDLQKTIDDAKTDDVVVMVLGEGEFMSGEAHSRAFLGLPGHQQTLLEGVHGTGTPVVVVLMTGRPMVIPWMVENIPAILIAWHGGIRSGRAVADILAGRVNPSGKLTATWPRTEGQIPLYYYHKNTGRPPSGAGTKQFEEPFYSNYLDELITPQFPFGFGLSYTNFQYSDLEVITPILKLDDELIVKTVITNIGEIPGEEIVQLYVRDLVGEVTRPVKELKGFQKITLQPGECCAVKFTIPVHEFGFHGLDMEYKIEPGDFKVWVGPNSMEGLVGNFEVVN
jgi:beta-glucosidase